MSDSQPTRLTGTYELAPGLTIVVERQLNGELVYQRDGHPLVVVRPYGSSWNVERPPVFPDDLEGAVSGVLDQLAARGTQPPQLHHRTERSAHNAVLKAIQEYQ